MKIFQKPPAWLPMTMLASMALIVSPSRAATVNSSIVGVEITYTFAGAVFTASGLPASDGVDYDFDGPPSHSYDGSQTFVFTEGDGSGSVSGSAAVGETVHDYPLAEPDLSSFDPFSESITLTLGTMGQSSAPDSNGSAAIQSDLSFSFQIYDDSVSLIFLFDYAYTFSMALVEDALAGGEANGFFDLDAELIENSGMTPYADIVNEFHTGPASIVDQPGSGQIMFVASPGSFVETVITANVNSTTLVPMVPEPSRALLLMAGVVAVSLRRRR